MVSILLASYNGEKYIGEQIDSLLSQTYQGFKLIIRDDCSTDGTFAIISGYAKKYPGKVMAAQNESNTGGAKQNFIQMMIGHKDDYVMLCDQDDIWLPDKISMTLARMKELEAQYGADMPILVHTDLRVVDERLKTISPSFKAAMNANYEKTKLRNQVIQNTLTGCTAMYNRALAGLITEIPSFMVMHDWWLILIASAFGIISAIDSQTVLYRQHRKNEIGAKDVRTLKYLINRLMHHEEVKTAINDTYPQAQSFLDMYQDRLDEEQIKLLQAYCDIPNHIKPIRWATICRLGTLKNSLTRKIANFIYI